MLGKRIKDERINKGLSQEELSKLVSVTQQAVNKWENNKSNPDPETLKLLSEIFGCSADYLLGLTNERLTADRIKEEKNIYKTSLNQIYRAGEKMTDKQLEDLVKVAQALYPEAFEENEK